MLAPPALSGLSTELQLTSPFAPAGSDTEGPEGGAGLPGGGFGAVGACACAPTIDMRIEAHAAKHATLTLAIISPGSNRRPHPDTIAD
jgi:hypothetical protein